MLLPQDIIVALKIALSNEQFTYAELSRALDMSSSQVYSAVDRCNDAGLVFKDTMRANPDAILELLLHGVKYVYPAELLPTQRGMPTAHSAPPLSEHVQSEEQIVWPYAEGKVRGTGLEPIHKSAPGAARRDERLYQALALVDGIRVGRARERKLASEFLGKILAAVHDRSE